MRQQPELLVYHPRQAQEFAAAVRDRGYDGRIYVCSTPAEAREVIDRVEVILGVRFPADLLPQAVRLRWFQSLWAGVESLVGGPWPTGVTLTRAGGAFGDRISEYVFGHLLWYGVGLPRAREAQRERRWQHYWTGTLRGRTLGVAGVGAIGEEVGRRAKAFKLHVWGLGRRARDLDGDAARAPAGGAAEVWERCFTPAQMPAFLGGLDYLVITLPLTPETNGMFGRQELAMLKPTAWLVNVGRGKVIDQAALEDALAEGRLGGAVLDVFAEEPLPPSSRLWTLPNAIVTPHLAGPSMPDEVVEFFFENLQRYLAGEPLDGVVEFDRGY